MRYLKRYKLFEELPWVGGVYRHEEGSTQKRVADKIKEVESITQTIKDILLPISDMGYNISVRDNTYDAGPIYKSPNEFIIRIISYGDKPLSIDDEVKEEFDRMYYYLKSIGFDSISVLYVRDDSTIQNKRDYLDFINKSDKFLDVGIIRNLLFVAKTNN